MNITKSWSALKRSLSGLFSTESASRPSTGAATATSKTSSTTNLASHPSANPAAQPPIALPENVSRSIRLHNNLLAISISLQKLVIKSRSFEQRLTRTDGSGHLIILQELQQDVSLLVSLSLELEEISKTSRSLSDQSSSLIRDINSLSVMQSPVNPSVLEQ